MSDNRGRFSHSRTLFTNGDGKPMQFCMKPCRERAALKDVIEHGGGGISMKSCVDSIRLISPEYNFFEGVCYSSQFVWDCVAANRIVDLDKYKRTEEVDNVDDDDDDFNVVKTASRSTSRRANYTRADDLEIIRHMIDKHQFSVVGGNTMWQEMERKGVTSKKRTWQSLRERFRKKILPGINGYSLTKDEIKLFTNIGKGSQLDDSAYGDITSLQKRYTNEEDRRILRYVIDHRAIYESKGNTIWKRMANRKLTHHTWQSMKERFRKQIVRNLKNFEIKEYQRKDLEQFYGVDSSESEGSPASTKRRSSRATTPDSTISSTHLIRASCEREGKTNGDGCRSMLPAPHTSLEKPPTVSRPSKRLLFVGEPSTSGVNKRTMKERAREASQVSLETNEAGAASQIGPCEISPIDEVLSPSPPTNTISASDMPPQSNSTMPIAGTHDGDSLAKKSKKRFLRTMEADPFLIEPSSEEPQSTVVLPERTDDVASLSDANHDALVLCSATTEHDVVVDDVQVNDFVVQDDVGTSVPLMSEAVLSSDTYSLNEAVMECLDERSEGENIIDGAVDFMTLQPSCTVQSHTTALEPASKNRPEELASIELHQKKGVLRQRSDELHQGKDEQTQGNDEPMTSECNQTNDRSELTLAATFDVERSDVGCPLDLTCAKDIRDAMVVSDNTRSVVIVQEDVRPGPAANNDGALEWFSDDDDIAGFGEDIERDLNSWMIMFDQHVQQSEISSQTECRSASEFPLALPPTAFEEIVMETEVCRETSCLPNSEAVAVVNACIEAASNESSLDDWPEAVRRMVFPNDGKCPQLTNEEAFVTLRWTGERLNMRLNELRQFLRGMSQNEIDMAFPELEEHAFPEHESEANHDL